MSTIDRRDFIKKLAITLAGSTAGLTLGSCSLVKSGYRQMKPGIDHPAILAAYREQCKSIYQAPGFRLIEDYLHQSQCHPFMIQDSIISLNAVGTFGDLAQEDRKHPAIQEMMQEAIPVMDRATLSTATFLERLSTQERLDIQKTMNEHQDILSTFQVEFDIAGRKHNISPSRMDHFNSLYNKCRWRLEKQDPSLVIDELITMTDKACMEYSITPEQRRELVAELSIPEYYQLAYGDFNTDISEVSALEFNEMLVPMPVDTSAAYRAEQYEKYLKLQKKGVSTLTWGIIQFGVGTLIVRTSDGSLEGIGGFGITVGMTGGAIIAIVGLLMALIGTLGVHAYE
jgi:hypothetical protein